MGVRPRLIWGLSEERSQDAKEVILFRSSPIGRGRKSLVAEVCHLCPLCNGGLVEDESYLHKPTPTIASRRVASPRTSPSETPHKFPPHSSLFTSPPRLIRMATFNNRARRIMPIPWNSHVISFSCSLHY
jgi:hypothetical protein